MSNGKETDVNSSSSSRQENFRNWVDTGAKVLGAFAIAGVSYVAAIYQSRASETAIINQREQAESQLRTSMLSDLIEPIIGKNGGVSDDVGTKTQGVSQNAAASVEADLDRQLLLAEMVTLNFHDHFEFKPLLLKVDARLRAAGKKGEAGRSDIASDARRVIDRQVNMLTSIDGMSQNGRRNGYGTKTTEISLMTPKDFASSVVTPSNKCVTSGNIVARKPTLIEPTYVCVTSQDNAICLVIRFSASPDDYDTKSISMKRTVIYRHVSNSLLSPRSDHNSDCTTPHDNVDKLDEAHVSIFDFPLTDNSKIMWEGNEYRYAISLYEITDAGRPIRLKVVWFPQGYVTERERPPPGALR